MQIVTDRAMDLSPQQLAGLKLHYASLGITLGGKTYKSGVDISADEFYELIANTDSFPTTSTPSSGEFADLYRSLAKDDPEILSIHISSGLSGTYNAARLGAEQVPEAHVTLVDTLTLSCPMGWQVEAAARAVNAGWPLERILAKLQQIRESTEGLFTVATMKYLIHGGRISHIKGLVAAMLNIKPVIGVEKQHGTYVSLAQEITFKKAIRKMAERVTAWYPEGSKLRVQPLHGRNPEGASIMMERMSQLFNLVTEPLTAIAPVLGAHTGPGMVGMAVAPAALFNDLP
ncbi:MAG TPA: DegV family protein [Longilinea sp.]|nr:DegV family protein [Longilinea sp.]